MFASSTIRNFYFQRITPHGKRPLRQFNEERKENVNYEVDENKNKEIDDSDNIINSKEDNEI